MDYLRTDTVTQPKLTFFCELHPAELAKLFANTQLIPWLQALNAQVSLSIQDFSSERAEIVRRLNVNGIPVIAWQLLPVEQGYWYNMGNAHHAETGYHEFLAWTSEHKLQWAALGVDIEPDMAEFQQLLKHPLKLAPALLRRLTQRKPHDDAGKAYHSLIMHMRRDGYAVHSYEFMFMEDDRRAGSCLLGRMLGVAEVPANKRVLMLYSSFFRPYGVPVLCNYACNASAVAVGITGGGVELEGLSEKPPLSWEELSRDLRLAASHCQDIHIFSLEGCVEQGFMQRLIPFDWSQPVHQPWMATYLLNTIRIISYGVLWLTAHPFLSGSVFGFGVAWLLFST